MEHLSKAQIVLLALFVSFVSAMATGVVVVTLMQQAPEPVLQTINNVVERTIEKVVPTVVEKPGKIVVVKDEDLMVSAIERNSKSVVAFNVSKEDGEILSVGVGVIVSPDGLIVTDRANLSGGVLMATINGVKYALEVVSNEKDNILGLGRLSPVVPTASSTPPAVFTPVSFGNPSALRVGQTAIVIGGREGDTINKSFISRLDTHTESNKDTKENTVILDNIGLSQRFAANSNGAPIITLDGSVVGFLSIDENIWSQIGVPANNAEKLITAYKNPPAVKK
ncbi:MAG: trypsin-like peptidase domain-containing protein [Candidatus Yonathbacteria bacterium]|nr:trypsin-like peptidase domain-containing protein [Candidatus Yonathbacteria bacterium]